MAIKISDMVGTEAGFANVAACDAYLAGLGITRVKGWWFYDQSVSGMRQWNGASWILLSVSSGSIIDTLANCEAVVPTVGMTAYPTNSRYQLRCATAGTWLYYIPNTTRPLSKPPSGGWSWDNQTTATVDYTGGLKMTKTNAADVVSLLYRNAPAGATWTTTWCIESLSFVKGEGPYVGVCLYCKATRRLLWQRIGPTGSPWAMAIGVDILNNPGSFGTSRVIAAGNYPFPRWLRVGITATNSLMQLSVDEGSTWTTMYTADFATDFAGGNPDAVGFGLYCNNIVAPNYDTIGVVHHYSEN